MQLITALRKSSPDPEEKVVIEMIKNKLSCKVLYFFILM